MARGERTIFSGEPSPRPITIEPHPTHGYPSVLAYKVLQAIVKKLSDYGYPKPHEPHPIPDDCQARKIAQVCNAVKDRAAKDRAAPGRALVTPLVHGYGPHDDFCRRFQVVADSPADGVWINRYGYLSDAKLDAVGRLWT